VPVGIPGELYAGGISLTRGYLNRPDITADRYAPDPFGRVPGARMYRSGDLARWLSGGHIEFLGRVDHQVNLFGHRIELGEIEAAFSQLQSVRQAAVALASDGSAQPALVAFLVPNGDGAITAREVKAFLKDRLPDYKTPSIYVFLDSMPLLPNGKINRLALASVAVDRPDNRHGFVPPRNDIEKLVAAIWGELLKLEQVSVYDNFFSLGGNSLAGVQMIYRVANSLRIELPVRTLFEAPTVADLAEHIERLASGRRAPAPA